MKSVVTAILACLIFPICLYAGNDNKPLGGKSGGMAHASVAISDLWSLYNNQAGLANIDHIVAGFSYENRFLISELSRNVAGIVLPTNSGTFGFTFSNFGYNLYNEGKYGVAYARKLSEKVSMGLQFNYMTIRIGNDYGSQNNLTGEIGLQAEVIEDLILGVHVFNPTQSALGGEISEEIPTVFKLGALYEVSDKVVVAVESEKDMDQSAIFKTGVEYHIIEKLFVRGGIATNPTYSTVGFGLKLKQFDIDFATNYHQQLGYTPQFSLTYHFNN